MEQKLLILLVQGGMKPDFTASPAKYEESRMSKLIGLNWLVPPDFLNAAALLSLFSVVVLVIVFFYLNWYTGRRYFSLWTLGWVFYAVWLGIGPASTATGPMMVMLRHWCVGLSAALLFWGSIKFLELPSRPLLGFLFVGFLFVWGYVGAYHLKDPWHADAPIFAVVGLASLVTAVSFYRLRKHRQYLGAGLLSFGFLLWGLYLGACPFFARDTQLAATGFVISAVLQLLIAVSMIILVLEEARAANEMILDKVRDAKLELLQLAHQEPAPGEEPGYQGVFDRASLSEKLKVAYGDLRDAQEKNLQRERYEALGQMSRGIAHDINNALTPILGYSTLLLRGYPGLPEDVRQYLSSIKQAGEKISNSVSCIRDFYREQGGRDILRRVELNGVARDAVAAARARWHEAPNTKGLEMDFKLELDTALPQIMGTREELAEALKELTLNAVESMPRGGTVIVRTGVLAPSTERPRFDTDQVFIEVADFGSGMDEKTRLRCLEPFFSTKEKNGARGLGLSKVFGIIQRHDAEIQMDSQPGEGTTVRLVFSSVHEHDTERFYANPGAALPPLRILCIDDEPSVLDVLRMVLKSGGHQVETADDGQLGLEKFRDARVRNEPFDVVLTDLAMPRVDGQQVARTIKQESFKTPIIMLTGWGGIMQAEGTHPRDVDVVLAKPPQVSELIGALQKVTAPA